MIVDNDYYCTKNENYTFIKIQKGGIIMSTPHNSAEKGDFAKTVLMPGDPLRAKFIAEGFLENARLVNEVRGMYAYTGEYKGTPVSVMASGMGMPSMGIYSYELFSFYDVQNIIRIGTAGGISEQLGLRDIVLGMASCTASSYADQFGMPCRPAATASYRLLRIADDAARSLGKTAHVGTLLCSDTFYDESGTLAKWRSFGVLAIEMESAALYYNAARLGKEALCICTISDCPLTGEACSAGERQQSFSGMVEIALETAVMEADKKG